jgi:hypothetical protein
MTKFSEWIIFNLKIKIEKVSVIRKKEEWSDVSSIMEDGDA